MSSVFDSIRSYFYVPAYREDLVAAAFDNDADAVVFDLEHLTPDDQKDKGRRLVAEVIAIEQPKPVLVLGIGDVFTEHGDPVKLLAEIGLDAAGIQASIEKRFATLLN